MEEERYEVLICVENGPCKKDCDTDAGENGVAPERVWDYGGAGKTFLAGNPEDEDGKEDEGESQEGDIGWGTQFGGGSCYHSGVVVNSRVRP